MRGGSIVALLAFLGFVPEAYAQAFGIEMGQQVSEFPGAKAERPNVYTLPSVPLPHPEFSEYAVMAVPTTGACKVLAMGKMHSGDAYGSDIRSAFESLETALVGKYGSGKVYDFIRNGALWDEPRDFAMSLKQGERNLIHFWTRESTASLPEQINSIQLEANASGSDRTYLTLIYEFSNFPVCQAETKNTQNKGL